VLKTTAVARLDVFSMVCVETQLCSTLWELMNGKGSSPGPWPGKPRVRPWVYDECIWAACCVCWE